MKDDNKKKATKTTEDDANDDELRNEAEDATRRMEIKRKGTSDCIRKRKKMKYDILDNWGEGLGIDKDEEVTENDIETGVEIYTPPIETVIENEIKVKEPSEAKLKISKEVRKKKFKYNKKGKLRDDEIKELRKTTKNVFDWMTTQSVAKESEIIINELEDNNDGDLIIALEKEERLERVRRRVKVWEAKQIGNSILEDILTDVSRADIKKMIQNILMDLVDTVEQECRTRRIFADMVEFGLVERIRDYIRIEDKRKRIFLKLEKEKEWLARRTQKSGGDMDMDWEEHSLEACLAMLGLEAWDGSEPMEVEDLVMEEDWLDEWIKNVMEPEMDMDDMDVTVSVSEPVWVDDMDGVVEPETDYIQWLVEQLMELRVEEDIISTLKRMTLENMQDDTPEECLRTVQCPGDCDNECVTPWDTLKDGNSLQGITDSTVDECIKNMHCPGNCMGSCGVSTIMKITYRDGSPYSNQTECHTQSGTVTATQPLPGWKSNQDGAGGCDPVLGGNLGGNSLQLYQGSAQLGKQETGFKHTVCCTQTEHTKTKCTVSSVQLPGVVQEDEGPSVNDIPGLKYCPGGDLPVYTFVGYKPSTSAKKDPTLVELQVQNIVENFPEAEKSNISKLIAEWEGRGHQSEDSLKGEEEQLKRRKSEKFQNLSSLFELQSGGTGGRERNLADLGSVDNLPTFNFSGVGGRPKLPRQRKVRVLRKVSGGEREILLASPSANGKRLRDMNDPEIVLPGSGTKKMRKEVITSSTQ
jgi:hypothetical protein